MKFKVKVSFAGPMISGQAGEVIDLPADSEYAIKFCEPVEDEAPAKPKAKPRTKRASGK